jgi:IclR family mhp operon transcriptional activator
MDERQEIKSLKKALRALTFMNQRGDATVTEVASAIGVPRTTAYRLLTTFTAEGYAEKLPHSDFYRLTSQVQRLASGFREENLLVEVARPLMIQAGHELGWSLSLSTPRGAAMMVRLTTNFDTTLVLDRYTVGFETPILHATTGLCFLAHCSSADRTAILELARQSDDPKQRLSHDPERLDAILGRIREFGFSNMEFPEYREGNVGVPVFVDGKVIGGLVMRYFKTAMRGDKVRTLYVPRLQKIADDIRTECESRLAESRLIGPNTHQIASKAG